MSECVSVCVRNLRKHPLRVVHESDVKLILTFHCIVCLDQDSDCIHTLIHFRPHRSNSLPSHSFPFPCLADEPCCLARWRLPCLSVYFQAQGPAPRQAVSQSGGVVEGRGVDACVREALSHIPPAAGSRPGLRRGVRIFLTTSQVPALIWELFISCQKTAFPCNCRRREGGARGWRGEEFGFKMSPGLGTASPGLKS